MANKLDRDFVEKIASAIVYRAVQDYIRALLTRDTRMIEDCESFFLGKRSTDIGDRFDILTNNLDGPSLMCVETPIFGNGKQLTEK